MKSSGIISMLVAVVVGIAALLYLADYGVSTRAIPSLGDFIASSTDTAVSSSSPRSSYSVLRTPTAYFRVIIAETPATRERGLSGRASLSADEGMLFVFPESSSYGFWMKDMNFPIDIVWIDRDRRIVGISENISPETYPNSFFPPSPVQFVLEVNAGAAKKAGIATGTTAIF